MTAKTPFDEMRRLHPFMEPCSERGCSWEVSYKGENDEYVIRHDQAPRGSFIVSAHYLADNYEDVAAKAGDWLDSRHESVRAEV